MIFTSPSQLNRSQTRSANMRNRTHTSTPVPDSDSGTQQSVLIPKAVRTAVSQHVRDKLRTKTIRMRGGWGARGVHDMYLNLAPRFPVGAHPILRVHRKWSTATYVVTIGPSCKGCQPDISPSRKNKNRERGEILTKGRETGHLRWNG